MTHLATTLLSALTHADQLFEAGRLTAAQAAYEEVLERAQERLDRSTEIEARAGLAHTLLRRQDLEGARAAADRASERLAGGTVECHTRLRSVRARIALAEGSLERARVELVELFEWARQQGRPALAMEACALLSTVHVRDERIRWLQRAVDIGVTEECEELGCAYRDLAVVFEAEGRWQEALDAWQEALQAFRRLGTTRQVRMAEWAVGALGCRLEDWPLAQARLEEVIRQADAEEETVDLLALALADLARVHEAAGDVIEARRVLLRAMAMAREHDLPRIWPERWRGMLEQANRLELD